MARRKMAHGVNTPHPRPLSRKGRGGNGLPSPLAGEGGERSEPGEGVWLMGHMGAMP
jgi:hypothetical protein